MTTLNISAALFIIACWLVVLLSDPALWIPALTIFALCANIIALNATINNLQQK
jgi:hypothetical protein